jgi:uncharacterized membrane protein
VCLTPAPELTLCEVLGQEEIIEVLGAVACAIMVFMTAGTGFATSPGSANVAGRFASRNLMEAADKTTNINSDERLATILGGSAIILVGLSRRGWSGVALVAAGAGLVYRGVSGYSYCYAALGKKHLGATMGGSGRLSRSIPGHGGVLVEKSVTISATPDKCYLFWRKFENLPRIMPHLESVVQISKTQSNWVARAPLGQTVSWSAEMIRDEFAHYIAWRSLTGSDIENSGSVRFIPTPDGRGTEVKVILEYHPPAGKMGATVAALLGGDPKLQVEDDLHRFKLLMENDSTDAA